MMTIYYQRVREACAQSPIPDLRLNWDFPKMHSHLHALKDIREKGASRNYNTKPNEKTHGRAKAAYKKTNFRQVASQVLHYSTTDFHM